jgi:hypothetical protein
MIVQSGNDACVALAEAMAGSEENFVQMMNREAQRLGMKSTPISAIQPACPIPALHDGARPGDPGRRADPRFPGEYASTTR